MLNGRELFSKFKIIIDIVSYFFTWLPDFILDFIWGWANGFEGKLAIAVRYLILKSRIKSCGANVYIGKNVTIKNFGNLSIGNNVSIHANCYIDSKGGIKVGNNVSIAHNSSLISFEHTWLDHTLPIKYNNIKLGFISIGDDVWIGCGVRILANTKINNRCVVAAGAVVNTTLYSEALYGGVPCKKLKNLV